ncbi:MAG TPA: hypothetical protein VGD37_39920 [Kofleriaceae bacterium]|jgi:hypothetical protein
MATRPPRDRPGPHPENQRKRRELRGPRQSLIGLLAVVAVLAVTGGVALIARPDGHVLRPPVDLQVGSPLMSIRATGVLLALVIGSTQAIAALLLLLHYVRARMVALIASLIAVVWSVLQMILLDGATWFQLTLLGIGALEVLLVAGCTPRESSGPKKMRGRP